MRYALHIAHFFVPLPRFNFNRKRYEVCNYRSR